MAGSGRMGLDRSASSHSRLVKLTRVAFYTETSKDVPPDDDGDAGRAAREAQEDKKTLFSKMTITSTAINPLSAGLGKCVFALCCPRSRSATLARGGPGKPEGKTFDHGNATAREGTRMRPNAGHSLWLSPP